jgi:membrane protein DedA with SNARE-associated domain
LLEPLLQWVSTYGYFAIFGLLVFGIVGLPVPDETLLVFSGYLASKGHLNFPLALVVAFLGSATGITCSYYIGRSLGMTVIHHYGKWFHITQAHVDRVHEWFGKLGHWALVVGYFVPGVRHLTAVVAGTSELEFRQFALYAYAGALFWVSVFLTLGYLVGDQWERVYGQIHHQAIHVGVALAVAAAVYLLWKWLKRRRNR